MDSSDALLPTAAAIAGVELLRSALRAVGPRAAGSHATNLARIRSSVTPTDAQVEAVVVAVHGMGDQVRNDTVLSTAVRFCELYGYDGAVSLGAFQPAPGIAPGLVIPSPPVVADFTGTMAFVEAHWADVARGVAKEGYTLQETKAWARSIVARLRALALQHKRTSPGVDYHKIQRVLEEIIDAISVIEWLLAIGKRAGLGEFNLKKMLDDYLGDVQLVTEFATVRAEIIGRFLNTCALVAAKYPHARIHVVAHSEGTVVSFLGLLEAADFPADHDWISRVDGFMTFGSPIDKHLILWPELFAAHRRPGAALPQPIRWRNYVDYSDPVGFDLDTARDWIADRGYLGGVFAFGEDDDFPFYRYWLPGKAHVDYWEDSGIFAHFIKDVVRNPQRTAIHRPAPPATSRWVPIVSGAIAYLVPLLLIHVAAYILVLGISRFLDPDHPNGYHPDFLPTVLALAWLVSGTTIWLRLTHLTRARRWFYLGGGIYAGSVVLFLWMAFLAHAPDPTSEFSWFEAEPLSKVLFPGAGCLLVSGLTLAVGLFRRQSR